MRNNNFGSALMTYSVKATVKSEAKEIATKAQDLTSHLAGEERLLDEWEEKTKEMWDHLYTLRRKAVCEESGEERIEELSDLFWNESDDEETQEWREDLTPTEKKLVYMWDKDYDDFIKKNWSE